MSIYDIALAARDTVVNKKNMIPAFMKLTFQ